MNKNKILLNICHDMIIFSNQLNSSVSILLILNSFKHSSELISTLISFTYVFKILKHSALIIQKKAFSINNINVTSFQILIDQLKKNHTEIFIMSVEDIDREIVYNTQCSLNFISIVLIDKMIQNLEDIKIKLSLKYQNFLDIFDQAQADKLSSHYLYNHKIKLTSDATLS
jgi:hypothetical protein